MKYPVNKNQVMAIFCLLTLAFLLSFGQTKTGIIFTYTDLQKGIDKAKEENKPVFIKVYANWCGTCKFMNKNVFRAPVLESLYNDSFVCIAMNSDNFLTKPEAIEEANWETLPALIYLNKEGNYVKTLSGLQWHNVLLKELN